MKIGVRACCAHIAYCIRVQLDAPRTACRPFGRLPSLQVQTLGCGDRPSKTIAQRLLALLHLTRLPARIEPGPARRLLDIGGGADTHTRAFLKAVTGVPRPRWRASPRWSTWPGPDVGL